MPSFHAVKDQASDLLHGRRSSLKPGDKYLEYPEVTLRQEDVDSIKQGWLTDDAIAFWASYLKHERLSACPEARIELKAPSISAYLLMSKEPVEELKKEFSIPPGTTHIFLPITDGASNPGIADGGCHWTLLLISLIDGVAFHYDSMSHGNEEPARVVTKKVEQMLGREIRFMEMQDVPQQLNGEDCGVIVCLLMQHLLLNRLLKAGNREKVSMSMVGKELNATQGRKEMLRILNDFRQQQLAGGS